ncbi:hypothetical protein V502_02106 [Pseudogymnoascus sp. VKM F-4520 (FW-2644)]|nr:hypothetical protein V502_02106 [Pseudogymnoascus sp. VKM F-4520 (FW-2644)]
MEPVYKKPRLEVASDSFSVNEAIKLLSEIGEQQPATSQIAGIAEHKSHFGLDEHIRPGLGLFDPSQSVADREIYLASRSVLKDGDAKSNVDTDASADANPNANVKTQLSNNDAGEAMEVDDGNGNEAQGDGGDPGANADPDLGSPITSGVGDSISELKLILPVKFKSTNKEDDISLRYYEGRVTYSSHYFHVEDCSVAIGWG